MTRVPVTIQRLPFLVPSWASAQVVLPRVIFLRGNTPLTVRLLAHELAHVMQFEEYGLAFYWRYLWSLRSGYHNSVYEAEARRAERNPFFIKWAEELLEGEGRG